MGKKIYFSGIYDNYVKFKGCLCYSVGLHVHGSDFVTYTLNWPTRSRTSTLGFRLCLKLNS